ncbi:MAG: NADP-dependent oxidoreductase [Sphingomonadales bacterium]
MIKNRRFTLVRRPKGAPVQEDFQFDEVDLPTLSDGQFIIRNHYASLDPAMRGWMDDVPSYLPPIPLGAAVRASTVGQVFRSRNPDFPEGQWVMGMNALEDYSLAESGGFTHKIDPDAVPSITHYLYIFGAVGLTAYFAGLEEGQPKAGETVLVSGAAGAVGSLVGQLAKIRGARTIGIAGGPKKCARLLDDYGYDVAIDYRGKSLSALVREIRDAAPNGVDFIFENVGGDILDAGLINLAKHGRIILCGLISEYNSETRVGARHIWRLIVVAGTMKGFILTDYGKRFGEGAAAMAEIMAKHKLRFDEHVDEGLENAYASLMRLFEGTNEGKMILKIA